MITGFILDKYRHLVGMMQSKKGKGSLQPRIISESVQKSELFVVGTRRVARPYNK